MPKKPQKYLNPKLRVVIIVFAAATIIANGVVSVMGIIDTSEPLGVLKSIGITGLGAFLFIVAFSNRKPASKPKP